jgi:hypothetical protein
MRTFEEFVGATDAYVNGDDVGARFGRLKRLASKGGRLAKRGIALEPSVLATRAAVRSTKLVGKGLSAMTGPIRRRVFRVFFGKLVSRRARLISWQRRRSSHPLPSEQREAQSWAKSYVRRKGVLGKVFGAALSGEVCGPNDLVGEPATGAAIAASIPLLIQLARRALKTAEGEGAPADPQQTSGGQPAPSAEEANYDDE